MDSYLFIKRNLEKVKRVKEAKERDSKWEKEEELRVKEKKANQMSEWEVNKT